MNVIGSFDAAAHTYDAAAQIQRDVAARLIATIPASTTGTILDIGCGTGILTTMLRKRWPDAVITAIDAAPSMVARARARIPSVQFVEADAANLQMPEKFDLITSSMALHWLPEPAAAVKSWEALLTPGGRMHLAVPVSGSLPEWKALCSQYGITHRLWPFPPESVFGRDVVMCHHRVVYSSVREFLRSMKLTGAASSAPGTPSASPAALRRLLATVTGPFTATFSVAYAVYTKTGPHRCEPVSS